MVEQSETIDVDELPHSSDSLSLRTLGRDALRWCTRYAVGNWFVLASFLCGIGAAVCARYEPNQTAVTIKGVLAVLSIVMQAVGWSLGLGSKKQCDKLRSANEKLRDRLQRVAYFEKNMDAIFGAWFCVALKPVVLVSILLLLIMLY